MAPAQGVFDGIDLALLDPADADERAILIRAEHPELAEQIERDGPLKEYGADEVNPRLHLTIHEVVATQLFDGEPPAVWATARRLVAQGYERHEILHMLGSALVPQLWSALHEGQPFDPDRYERELDALPGSWESKRERRPPRRKRRRR